MSYLYNIYQFGSAALPLVEASHEVGTGTSKLAILDTASGQIDLIDSGTRAPHGSWPLPITGEIIETPGNSEETQLQALTALRGIQAKLYRRWPSGAVQWVTARLDSISGIHRARNSHHLMLTFNFVVLSQYWNGLHHGAIWLLDDGYYLDTGEMLDATTGVVYTLDSSPKTITITNGGNVDVISPIISVIAGAGTPITALEIKATAVGAGYTVAVWDLIYNATIAAGKVLVIDCGSNSIKNNGSSDYSHLSLGATHAVDGWVRLQPTTNTIQVTLTGAAADAMILFDFRDGWA